MLGGETHGDLFAGVFFFRQRGQFVQGEIAAAYGFDVGLESAAFFPAKDEGFADIVGVWRGIMPVSVLQGDETDSFYFQSGFFTDFSTVSFTVSLGSFLSAAGIRIMAFFFSPFSFRDGLAA